MQQPHSGKEKPGEALPFLLHKTHDLERRQHKLSAS